MKGFSLAAGAVLFLLTDPALGFVNTAATTASKSTTTTRLASSTSTTTSSDTAKRNNMFDNTVLDEAAAFAKSTFPIAPDQLIERAKHVMSPAIGLGTKDGGECLADDFEFCAAVVGPIGRDEYLNALGSFKLEDGFDISPNFYGWSVDPMQPNRVWMFNRVRATHTGPFMGAEPTGKQIEYPPQVHHLDFDENGKIKEYGFYTCDRRQGNTGGLGGAFGFMYAVGKPLPIPECQPYKRSWQFRALSFIGQLGRKLKRN